MAPVGSLYNKRAAGYRNSTERLDANDWAGGTVITINDSEMQIGGVLPNAVNLSGNSCGGPWHHCTSQEWAAKVMYNLYSGLYGPPDWSAP
jgi:hypothetical protein